jgi:type IV pilus assembly protein PilB
MADTGSPTRPARLVSSAALRRYVQSQLRGFAVSPAGPADVPDAADAAPWTHPPTPEIEALAQRLNLPVLDLDRVLPTGDLAALVPSQVARQYRVVPVLHQHGALALAMENPGDARALETLAFLTPHHVVPLLATPAAIRDAIARLYDQVEDAAMVRQLGLSLHAGDAHTSVEEAERLSRERPVVKAVHDLIAEAVRRRASDIHLRPREHDADLLYRIDDEMVPVRRFLRGLVPALVSRVKVLGSMNLAEHRRPQDGRTTFVLEDGRKVDLRISVLPSVFGESLDIRLLDTLESLKSLDQIGLSPADAAHVDEVVNRSHGMFLTTGPTGCGKSTTLYSILLELRRQRINILTIEDPVEFHIDDIQQMQVNRAIGFTFASAMRNFLRHDPDVIMVGEIRDRETAGIAIESALTGHLVLSTLHTNTAATSITRLLDLGVEAYLLRAALAAIMAQRLVRLTCEHCRIEEEVPAAMRELLGVGASERFQAGRGCPRCDGLGVHKRTAVYELLMVTPAIRRMIVPGAEADRIHELAVAEGMVPITQSALALARAGRISLAEAWRVRAE